MNGMPKNPRFSNKRSGFLFLGLIITLIVEGQNHAYRHTLKNL